MTCVNTETVIYSVIVVVYFGFYFAGGLVHILVLCNAYNLLTYSILKCKPINMVFTNVQCLIIRKLQV